MMGKMKKIASNAFLDNMDYWLDLPQFVSFLKCIAYLNLLQLFLSVYNKIWVSLVAQT